MNHKDVRRYIDDYKILIETNEKLIDMLFDFKASILNVINKNRKVIIVGNGGSAAIASHVSTDLTKNAGIKCVNFNEASLITCFSNDFGYERWVEKAIEFFGEKGDLLIAISSSGNSDNIINGILAAKKIQFSKIVTFTGMKKNNKSYQLGDINFWVNSKAYNHIENLHQFWLLTIVDMIIGKSEYPASPKNE